MIKALSWRFRKYLGNFIMLSVKACSETTLFTEWSDEVFHSLKFRQHISYEHDLFFQYVWNLMEIAKMEEKIAKKFFVFQIIAFELGVASSGNVQHNTCHGQVMCQQTHQRFHLTLGETFSKSTSLRLLKEAEKSALMEVSQVSGTLSRIKCQSVFWNCGF